MSDSDFDLFWAAYPRKVGKFAAQKAYDAVRKRGVTNEELLAGIEQYIMHKPDYQDWCHPTTWLNQGRWEDDYTPPKIEKPKPGAYQPYVPLKFRKEA